MLEREVDDVAAVVRGAGAGALLMFLRQVSGMSEDEIEEMRGTPTWRARLGAAHTIPRELRAEGAWRFRPERYAELRGAHAAARARAHGLLRRVGDAQATETDAGSAPTWARESVRRISTNARMAPTIANPAPTRKVSWKPAVRAPGNADLAPRAAAMSPSVRELASGTAWEAIERVIWRTATATAEDHGMCDVLAQAAPTMSAMPASSRLRGVGAGLVKAAVAEGSARPDASGDDIPMMMCGFGKIASLERRGGGPAGLSWRRYLTIMLDGLRAR